MHPRAEKNFVGINVANAGDDLLVHQDRFKRTAMFGERALKLCKIKIERVRAERALFQKLIDVFDKSDLLPGPGSAPRI